MNWIEIITLRSSENIQDSLIRELLGPATNGNQSQGLLSMKIYRNMSINTDLSVHLCWKSATAGQQGSDIGLRLAHTLKEFGLVNHSAWAENKLRS